MYPPTCFDPWQQLIYSFTNIPFNDGSKVDIGRTIEAFAHK